MLSRQRTTRNHDYTVAGARAELKRRQLSYRKAAPMLNITYPHLGKVLTGKRESKSLLARIYALPTPGNNK